MPYPDDYTLRGRELQDQLGLTDDELKEAQKILDQFYETFPHMKRTENTNNKEE